MPSTGSLSKYAKASNLHFMGQDIAEYGGAFINNGRVCTGIGKGKSQEYTIM